MTLGSVHTSMSALAGLWLPLPLDQNWPMVSSMVTPPIRGNAKDFEDGDWNVTKLDQTTGRCLGSSCTAFT